jgi:hypothetical protein
MNQSGFHATKSSLYNTLVINVLKNTIAAGLRVSCNLQRSLFSA